MGRKEETKIEHLLKEFSLLVARQSSGKPVQTKLSFPVKKRAVLVPWHFSDCPTADQVD